MTTTKNSPRYRLIGTTDDVVECARCGKPELKMTVILELLDAHGESEGVTYYGSTCAARALAERGVRITAAKVRDAAMMAQTKREKERAYALDRLEVFGLPVYGPDNYPALREAFSLFMSRNGANATAESFWRCVNGWRADAIA